MHTFALLSCTASVMTLLVALYEPHALHCAKFWSPGTYTLTPTTEQIAHDFENVRNFPNFIGVIEGKHIRMEAPAEFGSLL